MGDDMSATEHPNDAPDASFSTSPSVLRGGAAEQQINGEVEDDRTHNATITVRVIKSFEYRTFKNILLKDLDLEKVKVGEVMEKCKREIATKGAYKPYRSLTLDTLKLYTVAHGHKTINLIINLDHDDWILDNPQATLSEVGAKHETEFSLFNRAAYEAFKLDPQVKWD